MSVEIIEIESGVIILKSRIRRRIIESLKSMSRQEFMKIMNQFDTSQSSLKIDHIYSIVITSEIYETSLRIVRKISKDKNGFDANDMK